MGMAAALALGSVLACGTEFDNGFPTGGAGGQGGSGGDAGTGNTAGTGGSTSSGGGQGGSSSSGTGGGTGGDGGSGVTCDSPYPDVVLADGPLAYWRLDETTCAGSCTVATEVGNFTGTLTEALPGGFTVGEPGAVGSGTSVAFNTPGNGYITFGDIFEFPNAATPFTLEVWLYIHDLNETGTVLSRIGNWHTFSCNTFEFPGYRLRYESDGRIYFSLVECNGPTEEVRTETVPDGTWQHIAATWDGATMRIYRNGTMEDDNTPVAVPQYAGQDWPFIANAGAQGGVWGHMGARFDEIAVYGTALSQAQIDCHLQAAE